jgi:predicted Zn-dependent peptidase
MPTIHSHTFENGLTLLAEPAPSSQSLAMTFFIPGGYTREPEGKQGLASLLAEMACRGAGGMDGRQHTDALEALGIQRTSSSEAKFQTLSAVMIHDRFEKGFPLLADMVLSPTLSGHDLEPAKDLGIQSIESLEDEPQQKVFIELRKKHFPMPFGRSSIGTIEGIKAVDRNDLLNFWQSTCRPAGAVIGFCGRFDFDHLRDTVGKAFASWKGAAAPIIETSAGQRGVTHLDAPTAQVHIGVAYDSPKETSPEAMRHRLAVFALSGGMSGRLFSEVREKRGLCYAVYASYAANQDRGTTLAYAGTTAPRAQETLDVMTAELDKITAGITQQEYDRAQVGIRSRLVMQGESTQSRAGAIASDQLVFGRPRTLAEIQAQVTAVTLDHVNDYLKSNPPGAFTQVTIGPSALVPPKRK